MSCNSGAFPWHWPACSALGWAACEMWKRCLEGSRSRTGKLPLESQSWDYWARIPFEKGKRRDGRNLGCFVCNSGFFPLLSGLSVCYSLPAAASLITTKEEEKACKYGNALIVWLAEKESWAVVLLVSVPRKGGVAQRCWRKSEREETVLQMGFCIHCIHVNLPTGFRSICNAVYNPPVAPDAQIFSHSNPIP